MMMMMEESILISLRTALLSRVPLPALPEVVWRRTGALNTWGTNAIEGNTLTRKETEQLLLDGESVGRRPVRDVLETLQHQAVFLSLLRRVGAPLTRETALEFHAGVFRGVKEDAGHWRAVNVEIRGTDYRPPRVEEVELRMRLWEREYESRDIRGEAVFPLAAWMHHEFEAVHPFSDGNGRAGRLLLNLHFLRHSWPPLHILPPDRVRYLTAMDAGHGGDLKPLEELLQAAMARSLLDLLDQVGTKADALLGLKALARSGSYSAKYLALRAAGERLPAIKARGGWRTSRRALTLYQEHIGRA